MKLLRGSLAFFSSQLGPHNEPKFPASAVHCQRRGGRNPAGSGDKDQFFEDRVPGIELDFF